MDIESLAPIAVGSLVWRQEPGALWLTVVCKATYRLCPGESQLAPEQEILRAEDEHAGGDAAQGLLAPSDLVPRKARADVMLVGHAYAPRGEVVRALVARLCVGPIDKEIEVVGERAWTREGHLRELARFGRMPLGYERAAGGPGTSNPLGVRTGSAAQSDVHGAVVLPNLQPVGGTPESREQSIPPVGFGPLSGAFPDRRKRLGRHATGRSDARMIEAPLPEDFDFGYFNAAPPDQQVPVLRDGERLILQNLHRDHPRLLTVLPSSRPRAFAERSGTAAGEVDLCCDTLWIDTDRAICTLTWRGQISLGTRDEPGRVLVALEEPDACLLYEDVLALAGGPPPAPAGGSNGTARGDASSWSPAPPAIVPPAVIAPPPQIAPAPEEEAPHTVALPGVSASGMPAFLATATARVAAFQPPGEVLPFARDAGPVPAAKAAGAPPQRARASTMAIIPTRSGGTDPSWLNAPVPPAPAPTPAAPRFGEPPPPLARVPASTREAIEWIWADPAAAPRIRAAFRDILEGRVPEEDGTAVARVLATGRACDAPGLLDAMAGAVDAEGRYRPPVVLVAGELRFPLDEIEARAILDAKAERLLLERRAYQRRALLGGKQIRALLTMPGAEAPCPVYLPDALSEVLPMFPSFEARLLAEAHAAQDQAEAHPVALRALALGRMVVVGPRRAPPIATPRFPV